MWRMTGWEFTHTQWPKPQHTWLWTLENNVSDLQVQRLEYPPESCAPLLQCGHQPGSEFHPANGAGLPVQNSWLSLTDDKIHVMSLNL